AGSRPTHHVPAPRQSVAKVFKPLLVQTRGDGTDARRKQNTINASHLQRPLLFTGKAIDLGFDRLPYSLRHLEANFLEWDSEAPLSVLVRDQAPLGHVIQCGNHDQRITLRVAMDQLGKTLRQA